MMVRAGPDEQSIIDQLLEVLEGGFDIIEQTVEILKTVPRYNWVGIYMLEDNDLVLRHYVGRPTEHVRIKVGQGICGAAVVDEHTIIVPNVCEDDRYIACSQETKSEIVVPIWSGGQIIGEIDIDSDQPDAFGDNDKRLLERVAVVLGDVLG
jgi:GAF domain-containing protein